MFLVHPFAPWQIPAEMGPADAQPHNAAYYLSLSVMESAPVLIAMITISEKAKVTVMANQLERIAEVSSSPITELQLMIPPQLNGTALWQIHRVVEIYGKRESVPPMTRTHVYVLEDGQRFGYQFPEPVDVDTEYLDLIYSKARPPPLQ